MRSRSVTVGSVALGLVSLALLLAACGGESRPPCPIADEAHCDFATQIEEALADGEAEAIVALSVPAAYRCPGPRQRTPELGLVCAGAAEGEVRDGYPILRLGAEDGALDAAEYHELLEGWSDIGSREEIDRYGNGALKLVTVGCGAGTGGTCAEERGVVFTARDNGRTRAVFWFLIEARPEPAIVAVAIGPVPEDCRESEADQCRLIWGGEVVQPDLRALTGYEVAEAGTTRPAAVVRFVSWER